MIKTDYYRYNALDCMITYECAMKIKEELKEFRTWGFYKNVVNPMIGIILKMEVRGVRVDIEKKDLAIIAFEEEIKTLQEKLNKAIGHELNVNAPKQIADFLYTELGLPTQYSRKTMRITTDEKAIKSLANKYPNIVFDYLLKLKERKKILSTYLTAEVDDDGRIRCSYVLSGTKSGRLASKLSRTGSGMNLQNVPKGICREIVIPDEGCMFISADLSQAEARVVAYLAGEEQLIRIFESGGDVHTLVAAIIFNKDEKNVTKEERELAKHIVHACNYGMGPMTFGEVTGLGFAEAKEKLNLYHINFPRIRRWQDEIEAKLRKSRTLETPLGRRRTFFGRWNSELVRDAYSYIPQSTVADAVLMGMIELDRRLPKECEILLNIHDEVVVQVPIRPIRWVITEKNEDEILHGEEVYLASLEKLIVECMTIPIRINERVLKIPVNTKHGYNWNEVS
jgi:DNA polymerase-1